MTPSVHLQVIMTVKYSATVSEIQVGKITTTSSTYLQKHCHYQA